MPALRGLHVAALHAETCRLHPARVAVPRRTLSLSGTMGTRQSFVQHLSGALLTGPWTLVEMSARGRQLLGETPNWLAPLLNAILQQFGATAPPPAALSAFIAADAGFLKAWSDRKHRPSACNFPLQSTQSGPVPDFVARGLPELDTTQDLAEWLGLSTTELDWFADIHGRQSQINAGPRCHYRYRWIPRQGSPRLLEIPKPRLKELQRRILDRILAHCPPHPDAHGFRKGHSCMDYAAPHCGQPLVLHMDLSDFFPSIRASRIHALFRTLGYPWNIARLLTGLCTNSVPDSIFPTQTIAWAAKQALRFPHLPQGAPSSPALANLAAHGLDLRLSGLARQRGLAYTRYADDLAFSGPPAEQGRRDYFATLVAAIALEEGFRVNHHKTRFMDASTRQQLTGIAINRHPNIPRHSYDTLKATLFNCARFGPADQNRDQHPDFRAYLLGKIAQLNSINPRRGERLRVLFNTIDWRQDHPP